MNAHQAWTSVWVAAGLSSSSSCYNEVLGEDRLVDLLCLLRNSKVQLHCRVTSWLSLLGVLLLLQSFQYIQTEFLCCGLLARRAYIFLAATLTALSSILSLSQAQHAGHRHQDMHALAVKVLASAINCLSLCWRLARLFFLVLFWWCSLTQLLWNYRDLEFVAIGAIRLDC
jgi:hypothetical protein